MEGITFPDYHAIQNSFTVLIIDDSPVNIRMIQRTLEKEGYRIISAMDGPEGRRLAKNQKPDLIILDVVMPDEDGFEVIKRLKSDVDTVSIPVIFLTGSDEFELKIRAFNFGAVDYLVKPCHPLEVKARVRLHLRLGQATSMFIAYQAEKLNQVRDAQYSILPQPENFPEAHCGVFYDSLNEAGGDFYDILKISEQIYGYFVADVSGHDIKSGFVTPAVKAILKQNCTLLLSPVESMMIINSVMLTILPDDKYFTACYAKLNRTTNTMAIVSAAHPPVIYVPVNGNKPRFLEITGDVVGKFKDVYYEQADVNVTLGDRFYIYSDGLTEDFSEGNIWLADDDKFLETCSGLRSQPINDAVKSLNDKVRYNVKNRHDDIVILGIEV